MNILIYKKNAMKKLILKHKYYKFYIKYINEKKVNLDFLYEL